MKDPVRTEKYTVFTHNINPEDRRKVFILKRIYRGCAWDGTTLVSMYELMCNHREYSAPKLQNESLGFRAVRNR